MARSHAEYNNDLGDSESRLWGHSKQSSTESQKQNFSYPQFPSQSLRFEENSKPKSRYPIHSKSTSIALKPKNDLSSFKLDIPQAAPSPEQELDPIEILRPKFPARELSRNGSEADSLIDLYHQSKLNNGATDTGGHRAVNIRAVDKDDMERSRWIHRDKLTMIEIQEYRDRGMDIPPELLKRAGIHEDSGPRSEYNGFPNPKSPADADGPPLLNGYSSDDEQDIHDDFIPHDPRTAEEIEADPYEEDTLQPVYQQHHLRSSSSRIPLSTTSPLPISPEHIERSTPLPRKRGASGTWDDEGITYSKVRRSRSQSVGSQILLDGTGAEDARPSSSLGETSPSKAKANRAAGPSLVPPGTRKTPTTPRSISSAKPRTTSLPKGSPGQRPVTRSGPEDRPKTAVNRPEGDPPWLATMYKPDPRLPPDQQILPTHAKRLMQEQWEREGKAGSTFDRDFTPLSINTDADHQQQQQPRQAPPQEDNEMEEGLSGGLEPGSWPLRLPSSKPVTPEPAKNSPVEHAGYSTIPRIQSNASMAAAAAAGSSPRPQPVSNQSGLEQGMQVEPPPEGGDQEKGEEGVKEKRKGCGCCVVM